MCSRQAGGVRGAADAGRAHRALCQQRRQEGRRRAAAAQDLLRRQQACPGAHQGREWPGADPSCTTGRHAGAYHIAITWTYGNVDPKQLPLDGVKGMSDGQVMSLLPTVMSCVLPSILPYNMLRFFCQLGVEDTKGMSADVLVTLYVSMLSARLDIPVWGTGDEPPSKLSQTQGTGCCQTAF